MANRKNGTEKKGILDRVGEIFSGGDDPADKDIKATKLLKKDHDRVRDLFKRYDDLGDRAQTTKQEIVAEITRELEMHSRLEEEIFYPACLRGEKETEKIVRESFEEHKIVKTLLAELARTSPNDEQYDARVTVLKENVEHHADEEEDELFPEAEDLLGDDGLMRVGREMRDRKEELQSGESRTISRGPNRGGRRPLPVSREGRGRGAAAGRSRRGMQRGRGSVERPARATTRSKKK